MGHLYGISVVITLLLNNVFNNQYCSHTLKNVIKWETWPTLFLILVLYGIVFMVLYGKVRVPYTIKSVMFWDPIS